MPRAGGPLTRRTASPLLNAFAASQGRIEYVDHTRDVTTRYYYDGSNVILETDESGDTQRAYMHGSQYIDERAVMRAYDAGTQDHYYLLEELYSVAGLAGCTGLLEEAYVYDTYGHVTVWEWPPGDVDFDGDTDGYDESMVDGWDGETEPLIGDMDYDGDIDNDDKDMVDDWNGLTTLELTYSSVDNPYFFTGRITDTLHASSSFATSPGSCAAPECTEPIDGTHYDSNIRRIQDNRNRTYDPKHGRWRQRDPLGVRPDAPDGYTDAPEQYRDGPDLYEYGRSRPQSSVDPFGLVIEGEENCWVCCANEYTATLPSGARRTVEDDHKWMMATCYAVNNAKIGKDKICQNRGYDGAANNETACGTIPGSAPCGIQIHRSPFCCFDRPGHTWFEWTSGAREKGPGDAEIPLNHTINYRQHNWTYKKWKTVESSSSTRPLGDWDSGKGKKCRDATCDDIKECLANFAQQKAPDFERGVGWCIGSYNCRSFVQDGLKHCCLTQGKVIFHDRSMITRACYSPSYMFGAEAKLGCGVGVEK